MKFIDWFAGVGGFRRGMELAGHECVGFCEFDKFAVMSYTAMHLCTQQQLDHLATLPLKQRQKEILKEEYRNGEWYADDVRTVDARSIPDADCWCFGFPCQDISVAGKQLGFTGNRSSLFFRIMYMVGQLEEEKRPSYLFIENVKNLLSVNGGWDFARLLVELDNKGYDAEWRVLNSKYFGVPQNRERCFIIGHFRGRSAGKVFPVGENHGTDSILTIKQVGRLGGKNRDNPQRYRVYGTDGIGPSLHTMQGGGLEPCVAIVGNAAGHTNLYAFGEQNITVRRLTPKECFRLQGWTDDYFEKAQLVNSDSQLYKQAGNGVTVNVIEAIANKMRLEDNDGRNQQADSD